MIYMLKTLLIALSKAQTIAESKLQVRYRKHFSCLAIAASLPIIIILGAIWSI